MLDTVFALLQRNGAERLVSGYHPGTPPANATIYGSQNPAAARQPAKVDLRPWLTAVEDQQNSNSCTANAVAGAYEYLLKRHHGSNAHDISRLFVYYNARYLADANSIRDEGSSIQLAIESLKQDGACSEDVWPFNLEQVNAEPSEEAYAEAGDFLVDTAEVVPTRLELWRQALASGHPIIFGIRLFQSFDQLRQGVVPDPSGQDAGRDSHGNHAMLCVGYSDPDRVFIVRNSWGPGWGDKGYCYIPYNYMMNQECNLGDSWIVRQIQTPDPDESTWSDDDESILESVEGFLANLSDEEYDTLVQRMGRYPLEVRLALLFLQVAGADESISAEETDLIAEQLEPVLSTLGSDISARELMANARGLLDHWELVDDSVDLFAELLDTDVLAGIGNQLLAISDADEDASEAETELISEIVERWQLTLEDEEEEEEGEEDAEEGEGDEDSEEEETEDEEEEVEEEEGEEESEEEADDEEEGEEDQGR